VALFLIVSVWTGGTLGFEMRNYMKKNIIVDVIPILNNLYFNKDFTSGLDTVPDWYVPYVKSCLNNLIYTDPLDPLTLVPPWLPFDAFPVNPLNYAFNLEYFTSGNIMEIIQLFGNVSYICSGENINNNGFLEDVPIVNMYASGDELMHTLHLNPTDPSGPLVQGPDNVNEYFKSYVTGSVIPDTDFYQYTIPGDLTQPPSHLQWPDKKHPNTLNRTNPEEWESYELADPVDYGVIVEKALSTVGTINCKNLIVNTAGTLYDNHTLFLAYSQWVYLYNVLKNL
jgi:hypothetical protein